MVENKNETTRDNGHYPSTGIGVFQNWTSVAGGILSIVWFSAFLGLFLLELRAGHGNPYLGIITYFLIPLLLVFSLILIPFGAWLELRRRKRGSKSPHFPKIDFNNPRHQKTAYITIGVLTVFFIFAVVSSYKAYEFTESTTFCGVTCHDVMNPEFVSYKNSPHARVSCVECHIGPGVDWYMRSKLEGSRQVYSYALKKYSKPIETPIKNMRPAQETCENCHWPEKFYNAQEIRRTYYSSEDSKNPAWYLRMLVHIGRDGSNDYGIHAHMYLDNEIYYAAEDEEREKITWVKAVDKSGTETIYTSPKSKYKDQDPPAEIVRKMDCMDCHNRPTHHYRSPMFLVNNALVANKISLEIPFIKAKAMEVLSKKYETSDSAAREIRSKLETYYSEKHPEFWKGNQDKIRQAIDQIIADYNHNFFPNMKVRWDVYPDHIGHLVSSGCFRCHDGEHRSKDQRSITRDCTVCHTIIEQGLVGEVEKDIDGLPFKHPFNLDESWKESSCTDCHTGGS